MWDDIEKIYSFFSALALVGPAIVVVCVVFKVIHVYVRPTPELQRILENSNGWYYYPVACAALRKRRVSLNFALLNCLDLALSEKALRELVGFWCLCMYFAESMPPGMDWGNLPPSPDTRKELVKMRATLRGESIPDDEEQFS